MTAVRAITRIQDADDVDFTSPSDGQVVVYNGAAGKWENGSGGSQTAITVVGASGSAQTVDSGSDYDITLTANCALTVDGGDAGVLNQIVLVLRQDGTGGRTVTWPANVQFPNQTAPTLSTEPGHFDVIALESANGGESWFGQPVGMNYQTPAVPGAPTISLTPGSGQVVVNWSAVSAFPAVSGYNLYRGTTSGGETLLASGLSGTSHTDTGLTNGTTYYYKLSAVNSVGEGALSAEQSATPASASAPAFRSIAEGNAPTAGSLTISVPAGVANGDMLLATVTVGGTGGAPAAPAGWTLLDSGSGGPSFGTYYRIASSEPASYTFTVGSFASGAIVAYSGASSVNVHGTPNRSPSSTSVTANSVTTTTNNCTVIFLGGVGFSSLPSDSADPAGFTKRYYGAGGGAQDTLSYVADKTLAVAGATGSATLTISATNNSYASLVAVAP